MLCALSLLLLSFAHHPPMALAKAPDALSAAYVLPDGTFADLCVSDQALDPDGKTVAKTGCEACRLSGSILLPQPSSFAFDVPQTITLRIALPLTVTVIRPVLSPNSPPRGPPLLIATV
ncbi:hypothetical protein [Pararhizobium sp.]|uniref:hypothetical protein n=1 Tax=Pararhizobium sp. TaxID=1977563 RepID=UPI0027235CAF|nr:hypothetical protein [Pararhizobium sp.]MDO9417214.1 hypothetical protein [Pararhizobium sp.]